MTEENYATIDETRRAHLAKAIKAMGSGRKLAEALELHPSTISGLIEGRRNIRDRTARDIERLMDWPVGLMDTPVDGATPSALVQGRASEKQLVAQICAAIPTLSDSGARRVLKAITARLAGQDAD